MNKRYQIRNHGLLFLWSHWYNGSSTQQQKSLFMCMPWFF